MKLSPKQLSGTGATTGQSLVFNGTLWIPGRKANVAAAVAPTVTDDANAGYEVGSLWCNTTADRVYQCIDATVGAAIWLPVDGGFTTVFGSSNYSNNLYQPVGYGLISANAYKVLAPKSRNLTQVTVRARVAPGGVVVDTYTVYKNGVATAAAATITGPAVSGSWSGSVPFVGLTDDYSVRFTTSGISATADMFTCLYFE